MGIWYPDKSILSNMIPIRLDRRTVPIQSNSQDGALQGRIEDLLKGGTN